MISPIVTAAATFVGCFVSSLIPVVNAEVLVLSSASAGGPGLSTVIALSAATGQMTGKAILYLAARGAVQWSKVRENAGVRKVARTLETSGRGVPLVLLASATIGIPPLFATAIACGILRIGLRRFLVIGLVGRLIRFGLLVQVPHLFAAIL